MGVIRKVLTEGNGSDKPKKGDEVTINYTGNLYDESSAGNYNRGKEYVLIKPVRMQSLTMELRFDSSKARGPFKTKIGVGAVIRGIVDRVQLRR